MKGYVQLKTKLYITLSSSEDETQAQTPHHARRLKGEDGQVLHGHQTTG